MMQAPTKAQSPGNPLMIIPIVGILAFLDYQANDARTIDAAAAMFHQIRVAMATVQITSAVALLVSAAVIVSFVRGYGGRRHKLMMEHSLPGRRVARMPSGMPRQLVSVIGDVLAVRSNNAFWLDGKGSTVTPLAWTLAVEYADGTEPDKLGKYVTDIENRLYGAGYDVQVRVSDRPLSLTIDNPKPPIFALRDYWKHIATLPRDERLCAPCVESGGKGMRLAALRMRDMDASTLVAGMPRSGKTQFMLSAMLSMCMANSPSRVSLIIADMKAIDTMPLSGLPHLACPVVTDVERIADILEALVNEMSDRRARAASGDRTFMQHSICVVVDELAELIAGTDKRGEEIARNIQRLSQTGLGLGIILILATQRVFDIPAKIYSKLGRRCVFRVASAGDAVAASGREGARCNLLPKRGAMEVFNAGDSAQRVQGLFVADAESPTYEATLQGYVADVQARWVGMRPGWVYVPSARAATVQDDDREDLPAMPTPVIEAGTVEALCAKYGDAFVDTLVALGDEDKLSAKAVERVYQEMFGKSMNNKTRCAVRDIILRDCID